MADAASIVGGESTIGGALARRLAGRALTTTRRAGGSLRLDQASPASSWPALAAVDVAFLCAAVGHLDACEAEPLATRRVNVDATVELARRRQAGGAFVVFLSSNQVFDGRQPERRHDAPPCPINEYGRQKAETEQRLEGCAVLRLTKVVTPPLATHDGSHHDLAGQLAASLAVDPSLVRRASAQAKGIPAAFRPRHTTLAPRLLGPAT